MSDNVATKTSGNIIKDTVESTAMIMQELDKNPQLKRLFKDILNVDVDDIMRDGEVSINEIVEVHASIGNSMILHGILPLPTKSSIVLTSKKLAEEGIDVANEQIIGVAATVESNVGYTEIYRLTDTYCTQSGEQTGICKKFSDKVDEPIVEERDMKTGEEVKLEQEPPAVINHDPNDLPNKFEPDGYTTQQP